MRAYIATAHEIVNKMESGKGVVKFYFSPSFLAVAVDFDAVALLLVIVVCSVEFPFCTCLFFVLFFFVDEKDMLLYHPRAERQRQNV